MPAKGFIGVSDHAGWAVVVVVDGGGAFVQRRRITLADADLPKLPHHHDAQHLPLPQALALIERVRKSADRHAKAALDAIEAEVDLRVRDIAIRRCPDLPPTVAEVLKDYRAQNVADTVMYRNALADAAEARGWKVHWYEAKPVVAAAGAAMRIRNIEAHFLNLRKTLGPPWTKDHSVAMSAAMVVAKSKRR